MSAMHIYNVYRYKAYIYILNLQNQLVYRYRTKTKSYKRSLQTKNVFYKLGYSIIAFLIKSGALIFSVQTLSIID